MKKIMFDDRYGLTKAVLEGRKTMTRRIVPECRELDVLRRWEHNEGAIATGYEEKTHSFRFDYCPDKKRRISIDHLNLIPSYKVGEVVAVAQSYGSIHNEMMAGDYGDGIYDAFRWAYVADSPGWRNKLFVATGLMPHQIRITNIHIEKLQDISDEDCIREGIEEDSPYYWVPVNKSLPNWRKIEEGVSDMYSNDRDGKVYPHFWDSPRKAFAALIDKLSGKGTFDSNPWVFVYEFELVK